MDIAPADRLEDSRRYLSCSGSYFCRRLLPWLLCPWFALATGLASGADAGVLRVGVYHNPPKVFADKDGRPSGIFGDLLTAIAAREDWRLEPVPCTWNQCLEWLESGRIDVMPDVALNDDRNQRFDFHNTPVLLSWSQVYEARGLGMTSLLELDNKRIAVLRGSVQEDYLHKLVDSFGLSVLWVPVATPEAGFIAVARGNADAVAMNYFLGDTMAQQWSLNTTPILFQPSKLFYATASGNHAEVLNTIDSYLRAWQADSNSVYMDVLRRWGVDRDEQNLPVVVWWAVAALATALLVALIFSLLLRRRVAEKTLSLHASEERLNTILDSVQAHIYIKGLDLRYQYANRHFCDFVGVSQTAIVGMGDQAIFDAETSANLKKSDLRVIGQGQRVVEQEICAKPDDQVEGKKHTFLTVKLPLRETSGSIYALCGISTNITEHLEVQDQLRRLAFFDPLTGLANRRLLLDRLDHAIASRGNTGYEGALLLIDLDNFKLLNDTQGHGAGDLLLQLVGKRLEQQLRSTDCVGRIGADEFLMIVEELNSDSDQATVDARDKAQALLNFLGEPYDLGACHHVVSVSIGIAMLGDADSVEGLLKGADLALAEAKSAGRSALRFFNPTMQAEVNRRTLIENALRRAIAGDQLELYVQPQVNTNNHIVGMEALLRWRDPELGVISPADFIPIAEAGGQMFALGGWVLRRACQLLKHWADIPAMAPLMLAVNISPQQFRHPDFVAQVRDCLFEFMINPDRLQLEVTENLLIEDMENTIERMNELRAEGIRFSLDDFGTGYSSLSYLKRLPLCELKIDQSFVNDLLTDSNDEAIVRAIIALGRSLDFQVIAEGVETPEQAQRLVELGCTVSQGYYFGRPQSAEYWQAQLAGHG